MTIHPHYPDMSLYSMNNSNLFLCWCHQIILIESRMNYVLCLQVVATQSARMLNSSAFVTSVMIVDGIFCSVCHSTIECNTVGLHVHLIVNVCTRNFILHELLST